MRNKEVVPKGLTPGLGGLEVRSGGHYGSSFGETRIGLIAMETKRQYESKPMRKGKVLQSGKGLGMDLGFDLGRIRNAKWRVI